MKTPMKGFTLLEIMIVVAVIALIVAIALPSFFEARKKSQRSTCRTNMMKIYGCIQQVLMESNMTFSSASGNPGNVASTLAPTYIMTYPICPAAVTLPEMVYTCDNTSVQCSAQLSSTATGHLI